MMFRMFKTPAGGDVLVNLCRLQHAYVRQLDDDKRATRIFFSRVGSIASDWDFVDVVATLDDIYHMQPSH